MVSHSTVRKFFTRSFTCTVAPAPARRFLAALLGLGLEREDQSGHGVRSESSLDQVEEGSGNGRIRAIKTLLYP
jgi:hypothetical protein